jgi:AcrR family transcriptional regulator
MLSIIVASFVRCTGVQLQHVCIITSGRMSRAQSGRGVTSVEEETGRFRQRRRTRAAIVAAAADLIRAGRTPSVNDVAEAADVSRRTVYMYFPTLEQLLIDATLGSLSQAAVDEAIDAADTGADADAEERVAAMIRALGTMSTETLPLGRSLIRLTIEAPGTGEPVPRRGYRRVAWIERALEPLRPRLDHAEFERLVSALAMVVGWEALIVLQDLRGLSPDEQIETSLWAARALIRAAVAASTVS